MALLISSNEPCSFSRFSMKAARSVSTCAGVLWAPFSSTQKSATSSTGAVWRWRVRGAIIASLRGLALAAARLATAFAATLLTLAAAAVTPAGRRVGWHVAHVAVAVDRVTANRKVQRVEPLEGGLQSVRIRAPICADCRDRWGIYDVLIAAAVILNRTGPQPRPGCG